MVYPLLTMLADQGLVEEQADGSRKRYAITEAGTAVLAAEAELVLECRKAYFDDLEPRHFLDPRIHGEYHDDHHRVYFGEVVAVQGTGDWRR